MSDPIVLRSDAIKQLKDDLIAGGSGSGSSDNVVDNVSSLASSVTSSQSSINTMRNDIANLKTAISTLKAQMVALVENNNLTLEQMEEITVPEPDAPVAEDHDSDAPVYAVTNGTLNSDIFNADSTATCKHYTYDNLHVIIICATRKQFTLTHDQVYDLATFPSMSGFTGNGYMIPCMGNLDIVVTSWWEANKLRIKSFNGNKICLATTVPEYITFFWFDRSAQSKLFTFEDGVFTGAASNTASNTYAVHAKLENLHFLSVSAQLKQAIGENEQANICQFATNLTIPTGAHMGLATLTMSNRQYGRLCEVVAPNNSTIAIKCLNGLPSTVSDTDGYVSMSIMWIDAITATTNATVETGTTTFDTNDSFAKRFMLGHLNYVQAYGGTSTPSSNASNIATFGAALTIPSSSAQLKDRSLESFSLSETVRAGDSSSSAKNYSGTLSQSEYVSRYASLSDDKKSLTIPATDVYHTSQYSTYFSRYGNGRGFFREVSRSYSTWSCTNNYQLLWFA